jgi:hypothetical protein
MFPFRKILHAHPFHAFTAFVVFSLEKAGINFTETPVEIHTNQLGIPPSEYILYEEIRGRFDLLATGSERIAPIDGEAGHTSLSQVDSVSCIQEIIW